MRFLGGVALLAAASSILAAQAPLRVNGTVRDSAGRPLENAHVVTDVGGTLTDSAGKFSLRLEAGDQSTITVRRIGFEAVTFTMRNDSLVQNDLDIELNYSARSLPALNVTKDRTARVPTLERFDERRRDKAGLGYFLTRDEIAKRETQLLSTILRDVRGVRIVRTANGRGGVRFARWTTKGGCVPAMWLDGTQVKELEVDDIVTRDVEAVEVYANSSSAPFEFATREFTCGVVAIWTRRPILKSR